MKELKLDAMKMANMPLQRKIQRQHRINILKYSIAVVFCLFATIFFVSQSFVSHNNKTSERVEKTEDTYENSYQIYSVQGSILNDGIYANGMFWKYDGIHESEESIVAVFSDNGTPENILDDEVLEIVYE